MESLLPILAVMGLYVLLQPWWPRDASATRPLDAEAHADPEEYRADVARVAAEVSGRDRHGVRGEGLDLVSPFLRDDYRIEPERFDRGLALLEHVVERDPDDWRSLWMLGAGYRRAGCPVRSYGFFARAFAIAPNELTVVREYQEACLRVELAGEGVILGH